jgi:hypothetical protein
MTTYCHQSHYSGGELYIIVLHVLVDRIVCSFSGVFLRSTVTHPPPSPQLAVITMSCHHPLSADSWIWIWLGIPLTTHKHTRSLYGFAAYGSSTYTSDPNRRMILRINELLDDGRVFFHCRLSKIDSQKIAFHDHPKNNPRCVRIPNIAVGQPSRITPHDSFTIIRGRDSNPPNTGAAWSSAHQQPPNISLEPSSFCCHE